MSTPIHSHTPWYREPWPWLLMAGPVAVVIAGVFTAWLAVTHEDGLVADDYYKQGLAINKVIRRESEASALNLRAQVMFGDRRVRVLLSGAAPAALSLQLVHPTRAALDRGARLTSTGIGWYEGELTTGPGGRWHVVLEDSAAHWRLRGDWSTDGGQSVALAARSVEEAGQ